MNGIPKSPKHAKPELARERGQVLVLFIAFLTVLLLFVGLGVDLGFAYLTQARLAKAADAAALAGISNFYKNQTTALQIAQNVFSANFSPGGKTPGYIQGTPTVNGSFSTDSNSNEVFSVTASATMKTFFIGVAGYRTLSLSDSSTATRTPVVMTLVLDHSGSMGCTGGSDCSGGGEYLPAAVTNFISVFDEGVDHVAVVSFGSSVTNDVPMTTTFKTAVANAVNDMAWSGYTCSEVGLTNALNINNRFAVPAGQNVTKIVVFFTDGMANGIEAQLACPDVSGCGGFGGFTPGGYVQGKTNRWNLASVSNTTQIVFFPTNTPIAYQENYCCQQGGFGTACCVGSNYPSINGLLPITAANIQSDATNRCVLVADQLRQTSNYVYCVGLAVPTGGQDIPTADFLLRLANANDPLNPHYSANEVSGDALITGDASDISDLFQQISSDILLRLTH
ncbi:MAG TPA: vWA domain-containing protein [Verrucomicrobiae bacterium]|nr:vWA domain-containing protein [Verrucomicrobiae bacterium]